MSYITTYRTPTCSVFGFTVAALFSVFLLWKAGRTAHNTHSTAHYHTHTQAPSQHTTTHTHKHPHSTLPHTHPQAPSQHTTTHTHKHPHSTLPHTHPQALSQHTTTHTHKRSHSTLTFAFSCCLGLLGSGSPLAMYSLRSYLPRIKDSTALDTTNGRGQTTLLTQRDKASSEHTSRPAAS